MCNNSWIRCSVVYGNNKTIKLYFNCELLATETSTGTLTGGRNVFLGETFNLWHIKGYMASCRVYNRELSASDIRAWYEIEGGIDYQLNLNIEEI
jgi:hypothetical protein